MSYGAELIDNKLVSIGFSSALEWLTDILLSWPAPWTVNDLYGKYYGTEIIDARGQQILSVWCQTGLPSTRQRAICPYPDAEYYSDSHHESENSFLIGSLIVSHRNSFSEHDAPPSLLIYLIINHTIFSDFAISELKRGGGPLQRAEFRRK